MIFTNRPHNIYILNENEHMIYLSTFRHANNRKLFFFGFMPKPYYQETMVLKEYASEIT